MNNSLKHLTLLSLLLIQSCSYLPDWIGETDDKAKLEGDRISILPKTLASIEPDEKAKEYSIIVPKQSENNDFFEGKQPGENLSLSQNPKKISSLNFPGANPYQLTFAPILKDNLLFILDGKNKINCLSASDLKLLWSKKIDDKSTKYLGGGLAYEDGVVYSTSAAGSLAAYKADTGEELWRRNFDAAIKSSPAVKDGVIVIKNTNNEAYGVSAKDGALLWNYSGLVEDISIVGTSAPVIANNTAIIPFSSGEVFTLNLKDGEPLWSDSLITKIRGIGSTIFVADIDATPVVHNNTVYVGSNQNLFTAKDLSTGKSRWESKVSIIKTPWVAGDFIYLLTSQDELVAIRNIDGGVKWAKKLKRFKNEEKNEDKISYTSPIIAGSMLITAGSNGKLYFLAPETGDEIGSASISDNVLLRPAIANNKIYLFSNDGDLEVLE